MKLTKILPITAISSFAAVTTLGVVSCSCDKGGQGDPTPTEPVEPFDCVLDSTGVDMSLGLCIQTQSGHSFQFNHEYTFQIVFTGWESFDNPPSKLKIAKPTESYAIIGSISSISLWFDHSKWVEGTDYKIITDDSTGFNYVDWSDTTSVISKNSILTGRFEVSSNVEDAFLVTHATSL